MSGLETSKYQRFEVQTIRRDQIKGADYNPRTISADARKRLKKTLKEHGLVGTLTWNRRTGNLVSGHQRLDALDSLEKRQDYALQVSVIDVDEATEKKLNVLMNNPDAQGEFDVDLLAKLNTDFGISFEEMGFSQESVDLLFDGDARFSEIFQDTTEVTESKEKLAAVKEARKAAQERLTTENSADFFFVVVFALQEEKDDCLRALGQPITERYINGAVIRRLVGEGED